MNADEGEIGEERRRVEHEEQLEGPGLVGRGDQAADECAEADAEVHHDPLHREGGRAPLARGEAGDQRGLRGPEARRCRCPIRTATANPCHGSCTSASPP